MQDEHSAEFSVLGDHCSVLRLHTLLVNSTPSDTERSYIGVKCAIEPTD